MCDVFFLKSRKYSHHRPWPGSRRRVGAREDALVGRRVGRGWGKGGAPTKDNAGGWPTTGAANGGGSVWSEEGDTLLFTYFL
jgi:hypothetical protein